MTQQRKHTQTHPGHGRFFINHCCKVYPQSCGSHFTSFTHQQKNDIYKPPNIRVLQSFHFFTQPRSCWVYIVLPVCRYNSYKNKNFSIDTVANLYSQVLRSNECSRCNLPCTVTEDGVKITTAAEHLLIIHIDPETTEL